MSKISLTKLNGFLKIQCDDLRAAGLDASEYKDYIIAMLFLKRVNDLFDVAQITREKNLKAQHPNITQAQLDRELEIENATEYEFFVPADARWKDLQMLTENIGDGLTVALNSIENFATTEQYIILGWASENLLAPTKVLGDYEKI